MTTNATSFIKKTNMKLIFIIIYVIYNHVRSVSSGCAPLHSKQSIISLMSMVGHNLNGSSLNNTCETIIVPISDNRHNSTKLYCKYNLIASINQCREPPVIVEAICVERNKCKQAYVATLVEIKQCTEDDYSILQDMVVYDRKCGCELTN